MASKPKYTQEICKLSQSSTRLKEEEQLAQGRSLDTSGRKHLLNTCGEFQGAVQKVSNGSFLTNLERALQAEVGATKTTTNEETP